MKHILFNTNPSNKYKVALLIKESAFNKTKLKSKYITPIIESGLQPDSILALSLKYNDLDKCPAKLIKSHLEIILQACDKLGVNTLLVADSNYFKTLTKERKAEPHHGYIKKCKIDGYDHINVILTINYKSLFYNPDLQNKLDMSIKTLIESIEGTHLDIGTGIIHNSWYPSTETTIRDSLIRLNKYPILTCDIETFSLEFHKAGIGSIAFAWNEHEGISFLVDYYKFLKDPKHNNTPYGSKKHNPVIKALLLNFFLNYTGTLIYHGGTFDIKVLLYELFMQQDLNNTKGLLYGLEVLYKDVHCTKIITYLATNTTAGNVLSLKQNAFEFAGNYAKDDIKDIRLIPPKELLEYNLTDGIATWYVFNKNYPIMIQDEQLKLYQDIMLPSMKTITHMELTGMPMDYDNIKKVNSKLDNILYGAKNKLLNSRLIQDFSWRMQKENMVLANLLLKKKVKPIEDFKKDFNPASDIQMQKLLYDEWGFKIIDKTDGGKGSVGKKTLKKLLNNLINEHNITEEELK